jgi:acyl-CoA synthetase (AMP-forming)/AMP-acid ligase II
MAMPSALAAMIFDRLAQRADQPVVTICAGRDGQPDQPLRGAWLLEAAIARGGALSRSFDPAGGPLALAMPCGADFVVTLFGALHAGFTVAPVAPPRPGPQSVRFNDIIENCRPSAILCTSGLTARLEVARSGARADSQIPVLDVGELESNGHGGLQSSLRGAASVRPAILQYTSGSTRAPRGVELYSDNILANAVLANTTWGMDAQGVMLNWLPHFHDMGLMGGILYPILSGGVTCLLDPLHMIQRPDRWLRLICEKRATFSGGPAFAFAHCLNNVRDEQCEGLDLSSWQKAFCGAEPVPAALMTAFRDRFGRYGFSRSALFASYGLAEYTLMVAGGNADPAEAASGASPEGCEEVEPCKVSEEMQDQLRIVDPDSRRPVADGVPGEIWLRGPSVAYGYLGDAAETEATFKAVLKDEQGLWLRTGDIAVREDNRLYVTGRLKDLLFANGRKIPAPEVEWLAAEQEPELNPMAAAALMLDDMTTGKAALLIELRRRGAKIDADAARKRIRQAVMGAWSIELTDIRFFRTGSLPRTSSGKVQRRLAGKAFRNGEILGELA